MELVQFKQKKIGTGISEKEQLYRCVALNLSLKS